VRRGVFDSSAIDAVIDTRAVLLIAGLLSLHTPFASAQAAVTAAAESDSARSSTPAPKPAPQHAPLPAPVRTLPAIEVSRERVLRDARRRAPTASVTDLRADAANRAVESLPELLSAAAGVRIVQYGGLGAFSTVSLRGAAPGQVSLFLDGVPITSAAHGVVDLSDLPLGAVERVEVYRGAAPLALGVPTPGGAVNLITAAGGEARVLRVAAGSFGTRITRGTYATSRGPWSLLAHAGYEGSRGDYAYRSDNGTPLNTSDDATLTRVNDRFDAFTALTRVAWTPRPAVRASVREEFFRKSQGVPGLGNVPARNPSLAFARAITVGEVALGVEPQWPTATVRGDFGLERSRFRDTGGQLGYGVQDTDTHDRSSGVTLELASPAGWRRITAGAGTSARRERETAPPLTQGQPTPPESHRDTQSAWLVLQAHIAGDRLLLHAGRRWDAQDDHLRTTGAGGLLRVSDAARTLDAPQVGARIQLPRALELRANWSKTARAPEFVELFGDQAATAGNPQLKPEHSEGWDAGGSWSVRAGQWRGALDWSHHESHPRELIVFQRYSQSSVRARNVARAELRGEETSARVLWRSLAASGSMSWLSALETAAASLYYGRRLPQRPMRSAYARLDARAGAWRVAADVQYLSDDFLDPINFRRAPSRTLTGASLSRALGGVRVTLEGKNLGDVRAQDLAGFPLPGRSVFVACETRFGLPEKTNTNP
jgi:iron complex outermembrane receptor protein